MISSIGSEWDASGSRAEPHRNHKVQTVNHLQRWMLNWTACMFSSGSHPVQTCSSCGRARKACSLQFVRAKKQAAGRDMPAAIYRSELSSVDAASTRCFHKFHSFSFSRSGGLELVSTSFFQSLERTQLASCTDHTRPQSKLTLKYVTARINISIRTPDTNVLTGDWSLGRIGPPPHMISLLTSYYFPVLVNLYI